MTYDARDEHADDENQTSGAGGESEHEKETTRSIRRAKSSKAALVPCCRVLRSIWGCFFDSSGFGTNVGFFGDRLRPSNRPRRLRRQAIAPILPAQ